MAITSAEKQLATLRKTLAETPGAMAGGYTTSSKALSLEKEIRSLEKTVEQEYTDKMTKRWRPNADVEVEPLEKTTAVERIFKVLGAPVSAGASATKHILGKGTEGTLTGEVIKGVQAGASYGDIIRSYNVPNYMAAPAGFALDVMLDPLNWMTAGTTALVPRVGKALLKGTAKGAAIGAETWALGGVEKALMRTVPLSAVRVETKPGVKKLVSFSDYLFGADPIQDSRLPDGLRRLAKFSRYVEKERAIYDDLVNGGEEAKRYLEISDARKLAIQRATDFLADKVPGSELKERIKPLLDYDPAQNFRNSQWRDSLKQEEKKVVAGFDLNPQAIKNLSDEQVALEAAESLSNSRKIVDGDLSIVGTDEVDRNLKLAAVSNDIALESEDMERKLDRFKDAYLNNDPNLISRFDEMSAGDKESVIATIITHRADIENYDKKVAKMLVENGRLRKTVEFYDKAMIWFKSSVIGWNPVTHTNAVASNLVFIPMMTGIGLTNMPLLKSLVYAAKSVTGKDPLKSAAALERMFGSQEWRSFMEEFPDTFHGVTSINPAFVLNSPKILDRYIKGLIAKGASQDKIDAVRNEVDSLVAYYGGGSKAQDLSELRAAVRGEEGLGRKIMTEELGTFSALKSGAAATAPMTSLTQEVTRGVGFKWFKELERKANEGSSAAKYLHWALTVPMNQYGKIDQTFKVGLLHYLSNIGVTSGELRTMTRRWGLGVDDVIKGKAGGLYKIRPEAATRIVSEVFMNYNALPGFVKIMRSMPLLGYPFASFAMANMFNTARTMGYNPAFFNRINNFIREVNGDRTPLEKEVLGTKYYEHLNRPTMLKLPLFFQKNPLYLNLGNMLSFYSMSLLEAPRRNYKEKYGDEVAKWIDRLPVMKDPVGQTILNYGILPAMLDEAVGTAGQMVYPADAKWYEKAGYAASGLAEPFIPRLPQIVAGAMPISYPGIENEAVLPYGPYTFKRLRQAMRGRTPEGIPGKEPASSRTLRSIGQSFGFPVYPMNLTYQEKKK